MDLNGNTVGKDGQALLDQLRANGTHTYLATVKVYGSKDGKPDLTNLIATRQVTIQLRGKETRQHHHLKCMAHENVHSSDDETSR